MRRTATSAVLAASKRLVISTKQRSPVSCRVPLCRHATVSATVKRHLASASPLSNGVTSVTSFFKDVVRTGSLNPPNPILESLDFRNSDDPSKAPSSSPLSHLPKFSAVLPYHLEKAAKQVLQNFQVELAELEVKLTGTPTIEGEESILSSSWLLSEMERIHAPIAQLREVSTLYITLAANPDQIDAWKDAVATSSVKQVLAMHGHSSPLYQSSILYQALLRTLNDSSSPLLVPFRKQGTHLTDNTTERKQQSDIHRELRAVQERLQAIPNYNQSSKAVRLKCVSDMYTCLGLTRMQAQTIGCASVQELSQRQHGHMHTDNAAQWKALCEEITQFLQPFLPRSTKLNLEGAGAFLDDSNRPGNAAASTSEELMAVLKAKYEFKKCMRLQGVLQGIVDFCDSILGIEVVEDAVAKQEGWNKNVRLLHLYEKKDDDEDNFYLGSIYLDPFADAYWRTDEAKELVMTKLFSRNLQQTAAPVAIMALKIRPTWDDEPAPMGWDDTSDLLFHFGKALQMILIQVSERRNIGIPKAPIDTSEFLGHFMEMWLLNDGFVNRLVQLSEVEASLDEETLKILRDHTKREKALDIVNTIFLSDLQSTVLDDFDPRGDETLVALQARLADQHLPKGNMPDSSDLSPLLAVFQEHGTEQRLSSGSPLWSELLGATVYDTFHNTDLREREQVDRLGKGIRNLFLRSEGKLTVQEIANLCNLPISEITGRALQRAYGFHEDNEEDSLSVGEEEGK